MTSPQTADRPDFLYTSALWVWYYANNIRVEDELEEDPIEVLSNIFGEVDDNDLTLLLGEPTPEPGLGSAIDVPLPGGFSWRLQFSNAPAVYHLLDHPRFDAPACLGWDDPHPRLPVLPWRGLRPFLTDGRLSEDFVLPLAAPLLDWEPRDQTDVADALRDAWRRTGLLSEVKADQIVDRLTRFDEEPADTGENKTIHTVLSTLNRDREQLHVTARLRGLLHRSDTPPHLGLPTRKR